MCTPAVWDGKVLHQYGLKIKNKDSVQALCQGQYPSTTFRIGPYIPDRKIIHASILKH